MKRLRSISYLCVFVFIAICALNFTGSAPEGYNGSTGANCTNCHASFTLNSGGGNVSITGLPSSFSPDTDYNFSINITHGAANRTKWGFSIVAVNSAGAQVGTFSTTNPNAGLTGNELGHVSAPVTAATNTYTFNNLKWKSPITVSSPVTFYYVANAANNNSSTSGDYIYAASTQAALPIYLSSFTTKTTQNGIQLNWKSTTEINSDHYEVQRSDDGQFFFAIGKVIAATNSSGIRNYTFTDSKTTNSGKIYYRLRMVDLDGQESYSDVVSAEPTKSDIVINKVFPTIIRACDEFTTEVTSDGDRLMKVSVLSYNGQLLSSQTVSLVSGTNMIQSTAHESGFAGMVFVRYESEDFRQTKSIVIQK